MIEERDDRARVRIVVHPEPSDEARLTVADAMHQVLDAIAVLEAAARKQTSVEPVVWRLESATTNSPFTIIAEAESMTAGTDPRPSAVAAKAVAERAFHSVMRGERLPEWMGRVELKPISRMMGRTLNGVADTTIDFYGDPPIELTKDVARTSLEWIEAIDPTSIQEPLQVARRAFGQITGRLANVRSWYGDPAITIETAQYGSLACRLPPEMAEDFGSEARIADVWRGRLLDVFGRINYNVKGKPTVIDAQRVVLRPKYKLELTQVRDPSFTDGLSVVDYLERLREGDLG